MGPLEGVIGLGRERGEEERKREGGKNEVGDKEMKKRGGRDKR